MAKKLTKKQNIRNWKKGQGKKAVSLESEKGLRKGIILT